MTYSDARGERLRLFAIALAGSALAFSAAACGDSHATGGCMETSPSWREDRADAGFAGGARQLDRHIRRRRVLRGGPSGLARPARTRAGVAPARIAFGGEAAVCAVGTSEDGTRRLAAADQMGLACARSDLRPDHARIEPAVSVRIAPGRDRAARSRRRISLDPS